MTIVPLDLKTANEFVEKHHRHNKKVVTHRFSIGLEKDGELIGVSIASNPVARLLNDRKTLEIRRVCVLPGYANACSKLLARMKNIGQLMGYQKIITYTLQKEPGSSLRAVNARKVAAVAGGRWKRNGRESEYQPVFDERKWRWELQDHSPKKEGKSNRAC